MVNRFASLPISAVFLLMGFVYYSTIFIFLQGWLGLETSAGLLNAWIFTGLGFMCLLSFITLISTEPGHVPESFMPDPEESGSVPVLDPKKNDKRSMYCDKCCRYKPLRTHHCRVCRKCVLRMDHHCVWINNCVGYLNYKPFIVYVFYAVIGCIYSMVILLGSVIGNHQQFTGRFIHSIFYIFSGLILFALSFTLGLLLGWHIYLLSHNMTTIEYHQGVKAMWLAKKSGHDYQHPFNVGVFKNIVTMMGPNILKWICPLAVRHLNDGIQFPTSHDDL